MTFTNTEKRLLFLYYSGSVVETTTIVREALADNTDPDENMAAGSLLFKLEVMSDAEFNSLDFDLEGAA